MRPRHLAEIFRRHSQPPGANSHLTLMKGGDAMHDLSFSATAETIVGVLLATAIVVVLVA